MQVNDNSGVGRTISADEVGGALIPRTKIIIGDDGISEGDVSSANPLPVKNSSAIFRDGFVLAQPDPAIWDVVWTNKGTSFVNGGGNSSGASYLRVSLDTKMPDSEFMMTSKQMFSFPVRFGYGLSMSQRILGQEVEVSLVGCDADGVVDTISDFSPIAISGSVTITTNVATINTAAAHGLRGGDRVVLAGNTDNRLNVGPVVVTVVTDKKFTVPCTIVNGTYTAGGNIYWADPVALVQNAFGFLYENATATNASFVERRNGAKFRSLNSTVSTTTAVQTNVSPYTDSFNAGGDMELSGNMEEVNYIARTNDSLGAPLGYGRYTQGIPDEGKYYKLRMRVKNLKNFAKVSAEVSSITKSGTTTATVVTTAAHGLTTGQYVQIYGARDQTNFPNLATPVSVTVVDSVTFTLVIGATTTGTSAGGVVSNWEGSVALPGAINLAIQSIQRTSNILTVTMNTTSSGLLPGEYADVIGMDGTASAYEGPYKLLRMTGSVYEFESVGADFGLITCGGAVVKRTDVRLSYIRILGFSRLNVELVTARGHVDASRALPVTVTTLPTLSTVTTVSAITKAQLDAQVVNDIVSAAITVTTTSAAVSVVNIQSCAFNLVTTAVSGTTPTMDVVIQETIDGTNWYDIYHFERVTANGTLVSPLIPMRGSSIRYVRTITGTTPSFTCAMWREQRSIVAPLYRRIFDRTVVNTTLNATTPVVISEGCTVANLIVNMGAITTTAPQFTLEGSEDNVNFFLIGSALTTVASSTVSSQANISGVKYLRAKVTTAGVASTLGYVVIRVL